MGCANTVSPGNTYFPGGANQTDVELEADQKQQNSDAKFRKKLNLFARRNQAQKSGTQQNPYEDVRNNQGLPQKIGEKPDHGGKKKNKCYLTKRTF